MSKLLGKSILSTVEEKDFKLFRFLSVEVFDPKNGDQEFFGIVEIHNYRTWCYFSQNQINRLKKDFQLQLSQQQTEVSDHFDSLSGFHKSYKSAKDERFYFNLSLIYFFNKKLIEKNNGLKGYPYWLNDIEYRIRKFKTIPLLNLALDDKQEIFYGKLNTFSFKESERFSFPQFNCEFTQKMKGITNFNDLVTHITQAPQDSSDHRTIKKYLVSHWIKINRGYEIDFGFLAFLRMISKSLGSDVLAKIIETNKIDQVRKNSTWKDFSTETAMVLETPYCLGVIKLLQSFYIFNPEWCLNQLVRWDLPLKNVEDFNQYLFELDKVDIHIQLDRYPSLYYLFNLCSKEVSKSKSINFDITPLNELDLSSDFSGTFQNFDLQTPKQYKTLIQWGAFLHNCAGNFEQQDYYKETISIGLFQNKELKFLASIKNGKLVQFKGFKNASPGKDLFDNFVDFLISKNLIYKTSVKDHGYTECCIQLGLRDLAYAD
jgi:hypothetical protein